MRRLLFKMQPKMEFKIAKNLSLKEKFKKEIYKLDNAPRLLYMDSSDVFVNKHAPYPNEIDSLNSFNWHENKVRTEKLKCTSYIFLLYLFVYLINHL